MQAALADWIKDTPQGKEAEDILRTCVHCGFCTATCPTYQVLGDELDGPRGRIYLIKQMLEGGDVTASTRVHLDRCLTCRSCESTCPSGVKYGRLLDIGREIVEERAPRSRGARAMRRVLAGLLSRRVMFEPALRLGQLARPFLPSALKDKVPRATKAGPWPARRHARRMLVLAGCVQPAMAPTINAAAARVLDRIGVTLTEAPRAGCCGALRHHLNAHEAALVDVRRNIDAWWPEIEAGAEAIVMTASGCGVMVRDYGYLLRDDPAYAAKARRVSDMTRDLSEVLDARRKLLEPLIAAAWPPGVPKRVAFHPPCTLQHGQRIVGVVERLLEDVGFDVCRFEGSHLCCGSAGTYSILQPDMSKELRRRKLEAIEAGQPHAIVTANVGCLTHLQGGTDLPVKHWIELFEGRVASTHAGATPDCNRPY
jgi:glycolate oxidase iron-sulfur subunit